VFGLLLHYVARLPDYRRVHSYDSAGRPTSTKQRLYDKWYSATTVYDDWGRVIQDIYQPEGGGAKQFDRRYNGNGYLARVERGTQILWQVNAMDAAMRAKEIALGNGLSQSYVYSFDTGRLNNASTKNGGNERRLQERYTYDQLGSITLRGHYWDKSDFEESFEYDRLNRLASSTADQQAKFYYEYDGLGNLIVKGTNPGVATHTYTDVGAKLPHAVKSIAGVAGSFDYDSNGNLTSGAGRVITWKSFDMPEMIKKGTASATFEYGPEHQRTRQNRNDGTVVVYAGAQEIEIRNNQVVLVKTYWPQGIGVEIDRTGASDTELSWIHTDWLGSPVAISDKNGNLVERMAYDPWGKRCAMDGSNSTPDAIDGKIDNRGFTGHEMLDQLDLVHMNGRIYDPSTARFISADPKIQDARYGQSYNRYSYVWNNPTNFVDPSGFDSELAQIEVSGADELRKMKEEVRRACKRLPI
jgi:RHS repeat-associated protein